MTAIDASAPVTGHTLRNTALDKCKLRDILYNKWRTLKRCQCHERQTKEVSRLKENRMATKCSTSPTTPQKKKDRE
jgi:hypothetical protein